MSYCTNGRSLPGIVERSCTTGGGVCGAAGFGVVASTVSLPPVNATTGEPTPWFFFTARLQRNGSATYEHLVPHDSCIVVFRGAAASDNYGVVAQTQWTRVEDPGCEDCQASSGLVAAWRTGYEPHVLEALRSSGCAVGGRDRIVFAGHSMGGALAVLAALRLLRLGFGPGVSTRRIGGRKPRLGVCPMERCRGCRLRNRPWQAQRAISFSFARAQALGASALGVRRCSFPGPPQSASPPDCAEHEKGDIVQLPAHVRAMLWLIQLLAGYGRSPYATESPPRDAWARSPEERDAYLLARGGPQELVVWRESVPPAPCDAADSGPCQPPLWPSPAHRRERPPPAAHSSDRPSSGTRPETAPSCTRLGFRVEVSWAIASPRPGNRALMDHVLSRLLVQDRTVGLWHVTNSNDGISRWPPSYAAGGISGRYHHHIWFGDNGTLLCTSPADVGPDSQCGIFSLPREDLEWGYFTGPHCNLPFAPKGQMCFANCDDSP